MGIYHPGHLRGRKRFVVETLIYIGLMAFLITIFLWGARYGFNREMENRVQIRRDRCAAWGENIKPELKPYCDKLGV